MNAPAFSASKAAPREAVPYHLAVVGGGIVGHACALRLAQISLRIVHIASPASVSAPTGPDAWDARVYAFSSSSQVLLERLCIWPALDTTRVQPVRDMRVFGGDAAAHGECAHPDLHFPTYATGTPQPAQIAESSLVEHALEAALRFVHTVQSSPHAATGFEMETDTIELAPTDGRTIRAKCMIDAGDKHSWARERTDIQAEAKPYRQLGAIANSQAEYWHQSTAWQRFLGVSTEQAAALDNSPPIRDEIPTMPPLPDRRVLIVRSASEDHARELLALSPEALCRAVGAAVGGTVAACFRRLSNITPTQGFLFVLQHASRAVAPRVVLVGGAAHVTHSLAEQGMNLGLRDVSEIGRVMTERETMRDHDDLKLLRRYECARREDLLSLTATTDNLRKLFALPSTLPHTVRNTGMRAVGVTPLIKRLLIKHALG